MRRLWKAVAWLVYHVTFGKYDVALVFNNEAHERIIAFELFKLLGWGQRKAYHRVWRLNLCRE